MVSKRTEELINLDRRHIIHAGSVVGQPDVASIIDKADRITVQDTDGKEYIDCSSQLTSVTLGHGQKEIIDAVCEQMNKLQFAGTFR